MERFCTQIAHFRWGLEIGRRGSTTSSLQRAPRTISCKIGLQFYKICIGMDSQSPVRSRGSNVAREGFADRSGESEVKRPAGAPNTRASGAEMLLRTISVPGHPGGVHSDGEFTCWALRGSDPSAADRQSSATRFPISREVPISRIWATRSCSGTNWRWSSRQLIHH